MNEKTRIDLPDENTGTTPISENQTPAPSSSTASKDFSGTTLGGYQLVRKIAEGGMGVVYEAIQLNLSRKVALKILNEELAARSEFVQRFEREAKAAAALNHPNIVQVHDFGKTQGWCYLIMEYVDGQDLSDYADANGKLSILAALDIVEQAAQALKAAGEKSIIHRDIKPSNLMLTRDGRVKISDLGLAKILTEVSDLTLSGIGMGSPYFMAPEQANDARDVDHRADIYALGLTLLFLLTGKRPYDGNTPFSIVLAHVNKPLPRGIELGTDLPVELETLIQRMAAKNPNDRYGNYDLLIQDLRRVKAGYAPIFELAPAPQRKLFNRTTTLAATSILLVLIAIAAFFGSRAQKAALAKPGSPLSHPNETLSEREPAGRFRGPPPDELEHGLQSRDGDFDDRRGPDSRNGGEGRFRFPLDRLPHPNFTALEDAPIATMLAQANDYAEKHPENFRDIIDRYRQVSTKARGTAQEKEVEETMDSIISRHQEVVRRTLHEYEVKMQDKMRAAKAQEAYDVWKDFPSKIRTRESDQQIQQMLERTLPPGFIPR